MSVADFIVLAVRTAKNPHRGISLVLFPSDVKGFSVGGRINKVGHVASDTAHLFFDECRIPKRYLLGRQNRGREAVGEVTMAKLFATELAQRVTYDCMQIFGGFGYTTEYPIGRIWRDLRLYTIGAGTSEIMKELLAKYEGL